jgi:predicted nucleotidyltransferase
MLFGSYARGTAGPDSDADLLVVLPIQGSRRKLAAAMEVRLAGSGLPKDLIVATPEDVERYGGVPGTPVSEALREGVLLYERPAAAGGVL